MWLTGKLGKWLGQGEKVSRRKSVAEVNPEEENVPTDPGEAPIVSARMRRFLSEDSTASVQSGKKVGTQNWFEELQAVQLDFLSPFSASEPDLDRSFVLAEHSEPDVYSTEEKLCSLASLTSKASPQRESASLSTTQSFKPAYELIKEPPVHEKVKMKRGVVGLTNPKLYCYLNASIQCLFTSKQFREYLIDLVISRPDLEGVCELTYLLGLLAKRMFSVKNGQIHSSRFWKFIQKNFPSDGMHDAPEAICYLLNTIDSELKSAHIDIGIFPPSSQALAWFEGAMLSNVQCRKCGNLTSTLQSFIELSLPVTKSLRKSMKSMREVESLEPGYICPSCHQSTTAEKYFQIDRLPLNLLITFLRFHAKSGKISSFVKFQKSLTVKT